MNPVNHENGMIFNICCLRIQFLYVNKLIMKGLDQD